MGVRCYSTVIRPYTWIQLFGKPEATTSCPSLSASRFQIIFRMSTRFAALITGHNITRLHAFLESSELFRTHSSTDIGIVGADTFSVSQRLMESFGIASRQCPVRFSRSSLSLLTWVEQLLLALASFRIPFSLVGLSNFGMILLEYGRRSRRVLFFPSKRYAQIQAMSKLEARCQVDAPLGSRSS
jgi:hypothetical protein